MIEKLKELHKNSYSPYSNYPVSAIVVMKDGKEYTGVNVENASYGATICAERTAILKAVSDGYRKGDFKEIHIMVGSGKLGMPCFICRQVMNEFYEMDDEVICYSSKGDHRVFTIQELCTYPFGSDDLK